MDGYRHTSELKTQFRDLDINAHVNNVAYVAYLEQARIEYFRDVIEKPLDEIDIALAQLSIDYEAPLEFCESVTIHTRVPSLGESSFPMEHAITTDDGRAATAEVTVVPYDLEAERARPIPESWRDRIGEYEEL